MADVFVQRLRVLTGTAKEQLAAALKTSTDGGARAQRIRYAGGTARGDSKSSE